MSRIPQRPVDAFEVRARGIRHQGLRRANERAVLTTIALNPGASNAEISRLSGLAPQTVSAILADLEQAGLIERGAVLRGRRGQPATPIFTRADGALAIGCEIGWHHMDVVVMNLHGAVLEHMDVQYAYPDALGIVSRVAEAARELSGRLEPALREKLVGIGVAMPTDLGRHIHQLGAPYEQEALWRKLDLGARLRRETGLCVSVFNDGNAACWAELLASPPPRPSDFVHLLVSDYIAAGIVAQGMLWEGPSGNSANLGSMLVQDGAGTPQIVHFVASISALRTRLAEAGRPVPEGAPARWDWDGFEPVLGQWLEAGAEALARVIFNTMAVVEGRMAIVDGIMPAPVVERLVARVAWHLERLPTSSFNPPQVRPGRLGARGPAIGAAELLIYRRYFARSLADIAG